MCNLNTLWIPWSSRRRTKEEEDLYFAGVSRVEMWRGGLGCEWCSLLARPFVCECYHISTMLRFHIPLIKPNVRFSRIRISDKELTLSPTESYGSWHSIELGSIDHISIGQGIVMCPVLVFCVCDITIDGAVCRHGYPRLRRLC